MFFIKKFSKFVLFIIYVFLISFISLEIIFSFMPVAEVFNLKKLDENKVLRYQENKSINYSLGKTFYKVIKKNTNNYGYVADHNFIKTNEYKYAVIGDSYVEALQIKYEDSISGRLVQKYGKDKVVSIGLSGASLPQYIIFSKYVIDEFKPKNLIIIIVANDFDNSLCNVQSKPGMFCYDENFNFKLVDFKGYTFVHNILRKSSFLRYVVFNSKINLKDIFKLNFQNLNNSAYLSNTSFYKDKKTTKLSEKAIEEFIKEIISLKEYSNITIIIDGIRDNVYNKFYIQDSFLFKIRNYLIEKLILNNINFIDLHNCFEKNYSQNKNKFEFVDDWHWNELGHKIAYESYNKDYDCN